MNLKMHPETAVGELKAGAHKFPLQAVDIKGRICGLLYSARVQQTFRNDRDTRMEAVYTFPLPPRAAVHGFTITIGERVIQGVVKERGEARREYRQAVAEGKRAALMEEERSDIFTTTVGNIGAGEEVVVSFELSGPLSCFANRASLRFPLVVGEVFVPGDALPGGGVGTGTEQDTDQVPDASRITPPRLADGAANPVRLTLEFELDPAGLTVSKVSSACHFARIRKSKEGHYRVALLPGMERLDRAFILEITYPAETLQSTLLVDKESQTFALSVVPPSAVPDSDHGRDLVIVLDRSGSMQSWSMVAARQASSRVVQSLSPNDRFGIIAFDNHNEHFDPERTLRPANDFFKMRAEEFLRKIEARGGTMMAPALSDALGYLNDQANRDLHILLITDGHVGNSNAMLQLAQQGVRISTVGIGAAAQEGMLSRMAQVSGGVCSLIAGAADLERDLTEIHRKWGQPVWKALSLPGVDEAHRCPRFWDVWQDMPTTFFGKFASLPHVARLSGWLSGQGQYEVELEPQVSDNPLVFRSWARARLLDLEDLFAVGKAQPQQLVELSTEAQVLCRFTAFSAVDHQETLSTETQMETVVQAVEKPRMMMLQSVPAPVRAAPAPSMDLFCEAPAPSMDLGQVKSEHSPGAARFETKLRSTFLDDSAGGGGRRGGGYPPAPSGSAPRSQSSPLRKRRSDSGNPLLELLRSDGFADLATSSNFAADLARCREMVQKMIDKCGEIVRGGGVDASRYQALMVALLDYQTELESMTDAGSDLNGARETRNEVERLLISL